MIKAYTILESLLTMIIASLIIVMMYTAYLFIDRQMLSFKNQSERLLSILVFEDVLEANLYMSTAIIKDDAGVSLEFYDEKTIRYFIKNDSVYRQLEKMTPYNMQVEGSSIDLDSLFTSKEALYRVTINRKKNQTPLVYLKVKRSPVKNIH